MTSNLGRSDQITRSDMDKDRDRAIRNDVLEEAARIAENWAFSSSCTEEPICEHMRTGSGIADAIRRLKL